MLGLLATSYTQRVVAQDNLPFALNAAGSYGLVDGQMHDFNLGEMVLVNTFSTGPNLLSQGFLQPFFLNASVVTDVWVENNVITPNGDGKNDLFKVSGLSNYPGSKISIYDRAGRKIYGTTDYKNDWNAMLDGKPLNEDTYYYIIDLGKGWGLIRGFISVVLDNK